MGKALRIGLLIESSRSFGRDLLGGVAAYARSVGPWTFYHEERSISDTLPRRIGEWSPDGIIARIEHPKLAQQLGRLKVPIVDLFEKGMLASAQVVLSDHRATAQMAADHLVSLGLRHFAFCGFPGIEFSETRCQYFTEYLESRGYTVDVFGSRRRSSSHGLTWIEAQAQCQISEVAAWLRQLPKPIGIMACNDQRAHYLLNIREEVGVRVPDEVMVVGVDNDPVLCELSGLSLSSVDPNAERIGYEAASLLHRMVQRRKRVQKPVYIAPRGIVMRQSTNAFAVSNQEMSDILQYVRNHACKGLTVKSLLRRASVSRGTLYRWFFECLDRSPAAEIARVRVNRVKELLSTNMTLEDISAQCGFTHVETMYRLFKRITGQSPGAYRDGLWRRH